jgi:hypothetical protein
MISCGFLNGDYHLDIVESIGGQEPGQAGAGGAL